MEPDDVQSPAWCSPLTLLLSSTATLTPPLGTSDGRRRAASLVSPSTAVSPQDWPGIGSGAWTGLQPHTGSSKGPWVSQRWHFQRSPWAPRRTRGQPPHTCPIGTCGKEKQKVLEVLMRDQDYDLIGLTKAWWAQPHDWNINMEGCSLSWKARQGIKEECVALYIKAGCIWLAIQGEPG